MFRSAADSKNTINGMSAAAAHGSVCSTSSRTAARSSSASVCAASCAARVARRRAIASRDADDQAVL